MKREFPATNFVIVSMAYIAPILSVIRILAKSYISATLFYFFNGNSEAEAEAEREQEQQCACCFPT